MAKKSAALNIIFGADTKELDKALGNLGKRLRATSEDLTDVGKNLSIGLTAPIVAFGALATKNFVDSAKALAQVDAAVKSTGGAAGRSVTQLEEMAGALQRMSLFDDDQILGQVTANLLTFTQVTGTEFDRAQVAILDMSTRLGTDLTSASVQVGKALNDPIKGVTALGRAGVQFTAQQKEQIEAMQKSGDIAGAQGIILKELETQFGGAAAAAARTDPYTQLANEIGNLSEDFGKIISEALIPLVQFVQRAADAIKGWSDGTKQFVLVAGGLLALLGPMLIVVGQLIGAYTTISGAAAMAGKAIGVMNASMLTNPITAIALAVAAAVALIITNWDEIVAYFTTGHGVGVLDSLKGAFEQSMEAVKAVWAAAVGFLQAFWDRFGEAIMQTIGVSMDVVMQILGSAFSVIEGILATFTALFKGDWRKFLSGLVDVAASMWQLITNTIIGALRKIANGVDLVLQALGIDSNIEGWLGGIQDDVNAFFDSIKSGAKESADSMKDLGTALKQPVQKQNESDAYWSAEATKRLAEMRAEQEKQNDTLEDTSNLQQSVQQKLKGRIADIEAEFQVTGDLEVKINALKDAYLNAAIEARKLKDVNLSEELYQQFLATGRVEGGPMTPLAPIATPDAVPQVGGATPVPVLQDTTASVQRLNEHIDALDAADALRRKAEEAAELETLMQRLEDTAMQLGHSFGVAFGQLITGAEGGKDAMKQFASQAIDAAFMAASGFAVQAATQSSLATGPAAAIVLPALITAGLAGLREVFRGITGLATGGLTTGPMLAMIGDNQSGKEAVIPFERMGEFLQMAGVGAQSNQNIVVQGRISGRDILISNQRTGRDANRYR